jgi:hypothetical protein
LVVLELLIQEVVAALVHPLLVAAAQAALALSSSLTLAHKCFLVEQSHLLVATLFTHLLLAGL